MLTDVELIDNDTRLSMTARLNDPEAGRSLAAGDPAGRTVIAMSRRVLGDAAPLPEPLRTQVV